MISSTVLGKKISDWIKEYPLLENIIALKESLWINPEHNDFDIAMENI